MPKSDNLIKKSLTDQQKPIKCVDWSITRKCNYNCSYCASRKWRSWNVRDPDPYIFLDYFIKYLSGSWYFMIAGSGEPFLAPNFLDVAKKLVAMGHTISIVTNFSAPLDTIIKFCDIIGDNMISFNASLHLEIVNYNEFLKKAIAVKQASSGDFCVTAVAVKGKIKKFKSVGEQFQNKGINFSLHLDKKYKGSKENIFPNYSKQEIDIIRSFKKKYYQKNDLMFKGSPCWAGSKYFVVGENGDAWRCWPAQNYIKKSDKNEYLGSLLKGTFKLNNNAIACRAKYCYCILPLKLGMVENRR